MLLYLYSFVFFLIFVEYISSMIFMVDVDFSLSCYFRDVDSVVVLIFLSLNVSFQIFLCFVNILVMSMLENRFFNNVEVKFVVQLLEIVFILNFLMVVNGKYYIGKVKEKNVVEKEYEKVKKENKSIGFVSFIELE